jgi:hypothetical protein
VISPLLANIYLHYVLDLWAERWRRHEATGDMISLCAAPTTSSSGSSTRATPGASWRQCARGWGSSLALRMERAARPPGSGPPASDHAVI